MSLVCMIDSVVPVRVAINYSAVPAVIGNVRLSRKTERWPDDANNFKSAVTVTCRSQSGQRRSIESTEDQIEVRSQKDVVTSSRSKVTWIPQQFVKLRSSFLGF